MKSIKLNNGIEMPQMGYGVYQIAPDAYERHVAAGNLCTVQSFVPAYP